MTLNNIRICQQEWKPYGNLRVLFNEKLIISPVRPWWWLLEVYTFVGLAIFIYEYNRFNNWVMAGGVFLGLCSILGSFKTTCSDPGVFLKPRPEDALKNKAEADEQALSTGCRRLIKSVEVEDTDRDGNVNIRTELHPYCHWCQHYRPPSSSHCTTCDCCIKGYDHHCPVYGGCIGEKNKSWFIIMVSFVPLFWMYLLVNSTLVIVSNEKASHPTSFPLTLYCVMFGLLGSIFLPPILSLFPSLDRVHTMHRRMKQSPFIRRKLPQSLNNNIEPTDQQATSDDVQSANEHSDEPSTEDKFDSIQYHDIV